MESGELCVMTLLATSMLELPATVLVLGEVHVFLNINEHLYNIKDETRKGGNCDALQLQAVITPSA